MTNNKIIIYVPAGFEGERLDIFCARKVADRTRSYFTKLAASGNITIGGKIAKPSARIKPGMKIEIALTARRLWNFVRKIFR